MLTRDTRAEKMGHLKLKNAQTSKLVLPFGILKEGAWALPCFLPISTSCLMVVKPCISPSRRKMCFLGMPTFFAASIATSMDVGLVARNLASAVLRA